MRHAERCQAVRGLASRKVSCCCPFVAEEAVHEGPAAVVQQKWIPVAKLDLYRLLVIEVIDAVFKLHLPPETLEATDPR